MRNMITFLHVPTSFSWHIKHQELHTRAVYVVVKFLAPQKRKITNQKSRDGCMSHLMHFILQYVIVPGYVILLYSSNMYVFSSLCRLKIGIWVLRSAKENYRSCKEKCYLEGRMMMNAKLHDDLTFNHGETFRKQLETNHKRFNRLKGVITAEF